MRNGGTTSNPFTAGANPASEAVIATHIARVVDEILSTVPMVRAIILTGSFGRGEGGVQIVGSTCKPQNDYDFVVVTDRPTRSRRLPSVQRNLASELGVDYVDIGIVPATGLSELAPTIFNYDLGEGSRVVHGDPGLLDKIPRYAPSDIPLDEAFLLLVNRCAGVLTAIDTYPDPVTLDDTPYLRSQVTKLAVACGDAFLVSRGEYHNRVSERARRIEGAMSTPWDRREEWQLIIREAYLQKLGPTSGFRLNAGEHLDAVALLALAMLEVTASGLADRSWPPGEIIAVAESVRRTWRYKDRQLSMRTKLRLWCTMAGNRPSLRLLLRSPFSLAAAAIATVILVFASLAGGRRKTLCAAERILQIQAFSNVSGGEDEIWKRLRDRSLEAWSVTAH